MKKVLFALFPLLFAGVQAQAQQSWIAIATGSNSTAVYAYTGRSSSDNKAKTLVMDACHREGNRCTYLKSWDYGCIYAVTGHDSNGRAHLGFGPSWNSATQQCEKTGATCRTRAKGEIASMCVLENTTSMYHEAPKPMAQSPGMSAPSENYRKPTAPADVSRGSPNYNPNEDEGPGDEAEARRSKAYLPAEDMARLQSNRKRTEMTLCPEHDKENRCFVFVDGDTPGRLVTNSQLYAAEGRFKGGREEPSKNNSLGMETMLAIMQANSIRVRYQFADLAKGTPDGRYEGLICVALADQEHSKSPSWGGCAYVRELRDRRK